MRTSLRSASLAMYVLVLACGDAPIPSATSGGTDSHTSEATGAGLDSSGSAAGSTSDPGAATSGDSTGADSSADGGGPPVVFDVFTPDVPVGGVFCVAGEVEVVEDCVDRAPPESFEPEVQWAWEGTDALRESFVTPLVANFTDDDDNGVIDLCDVPDVVVLGHAAGVIPSGNGRIAVLDGATGALHFQIDTPLSGHVNPAIGDIDGDGLVEIVAAINEDIMVGRLVAFEHDGSLKWTGDTLFTVAQHAIALADVDADGDVEIMLDAHLADHEGHQIWDHGSDQGIQITTAADLDDDGDLEIILGAQAYHHDGTEYWNLPDVPSWGHPHVADIDGDGRPEVVVAALDGVAVIEHDGVVTATAAVPGLSAWRPGAIHDIDGDGQPEILLGAANSYSALTVDFAELWTATVQDSSGYAAGTAFDFLGDGTAEAMYADETTMFVFGEGGAVLMTAPRASWTQAENPVVADVDNDGSAEIVVVSNRGYSNSMQPVVQVLRDAEDRWIPARRIWNQHAYHVTNVREDGTIPQQQVPHWTSLNTFRTQAQVSASGSVCVPAG